MTRRGRDQDVDGNPDTVPADKLHSNEGCQNLLSAPDHLRAAGSAFYRSVAGEYGITDSAGMALLVTAAECVDRMRAAQASIAEHGELVIDRYGAPKLNPACNLEKDARSGFLAA